MATYGGGAKSHMCLFDVSNGMGRGGGVGVNFQEEQMYPEKI